MAVLTRFMDCSCQGRSAGRALCLTVWPAPGSEDTELGVFMGPEVVMERRRFTREFKLEAVRLIKDRGVSYAQAYEES